MHRTINNYPSHGSVASSLIQPPLVDYYHPKSMISRMATHWYEYECTVARKSLEQPTSPSWRVELTDTREIVKRVGGVVWSAMMDRHRRRRSAPKRELQREEKIHWRVFMYLCLNLAILTFSNLNSVHLYRGIIIRRYCTFPRLSHYNTYVLYVLPLHP